MNNTTIAPRILELAQRLKREGKPQPIESSRFVDVLSKQNISAAFSNGMTLQELTDFLEQTVGENPVA